VAALLGPSHLASCSLKAVASSSLFRPASRPDAPPSGIPGMTEAETREHK
jgi:hypothetical protein